MARYYSVRGHIECAEEQLEEIREITERVADASVDSRQIAEDVKNLYQGGWVFPKRQINYVNYVFFGAHVQHSGRTMVWDQLTALKDLADLGGLFLVDDDEGGEHSFWILENGTVIEQEREFLLSAG